jgi:hypothetical protein
MSKILTWVSFPGNQILYLQPRQPHLILPDTTHKASPPHDYLRLQHHSITFDARHFPIFHHYYINYQIITPYQNHHQNSIDILIVNPSQDHHRRKRLTRAYPLSQATTFLYSTLYLPQTFADSVLFGTMEKILSCRLS